MIKVAPSILSADFANLGHAVECAEQWGADYLHYDVMDGHFVSNLTFGPGMLAALRGHTKLPIDVHLMMDEPSKWVEAFAKAGADIITFHAEAERHIHGVLQTIHSLGCRAGVVLNPASPACMVEEVLPFCDMVVLMTVNPGFGGQKFIPEVMKKVRELKSIIDSEGYRTEIEVDGGINAETARLCEKAGADVLVTGSSVFLSDDPAATIRAIRG